MTNVLDTIPQLATRFESETPEALLDFAYSRFGESVALACSFGAEDVVLAEMVARVHPGGRVFYLDTDFLFSETHAVRERIAARYPLKIEACRPALTPDEQALRFGDSLWAHQPNQCCSIRKVEPLTTQLSKLSAWITGVRRDQAPTRANTPKVEWDEKFGLVKFNPLADWTWDQVWEHIRRHKVPYNEMHDRNYPSIGCTHCTRQVLPGEDPRAGRWSGSEKTECGLHNSAGLKKLQVRLGALAHSGNKYSISTKKHSA